MHDFPFDACPTALDLSAYTHRGLAGEDSDADARIRNHLGTCLHCTRVIEACSSQDAFADYEFTRPPVELGCQDVARTMLRDALASSHDQPSAGDLWLTRFGKARASTWAPDADRWVVLVLDRYYREYTQEWAIEVFPVTEREPGPAEWTYVIPEFGSGWGEPLSVHIDFHFSCESTDLVRRMARVSESCQLDIQAAYRDYSAGKDGPSAPDVGEFGSVWNRRTSEWQEFAECVFSLISAAALPLPVDDPVAGERTVPGQADRPWPAGPTSADSATVHGHYEAPTLPFGPVRAAGRQERVTFSETQHWTRVSNHAGSLPSILGLIHELRNQVSSGSHRLQNPRVILDPPEDLSYLRDIQRLPGTVDPMEVMRHVKNATGRAISFMTALLITEAHLAAEEYDGSGLLQRAARRGGGGEQRG